MLLLLLTGPPAAGFDLVDDLLRAQGMWLPLIIFHRLLICSRHSVIRGKVIEVGAGRGHWQRIGEAGVRVENLGHQQGNPSWRFVAGAVHEIALRLDTRRFLDRLREVTLMWDLDDILPHS